MGRKSILNSKKANIFLEIIIIVIALFIGIIAIIIASKTLTDYNTEIQTANETSEVGMRILQDQTSSHTSLLDGAFMFLFIGLWLSAIIFAFFIDTNPIFMIISLFLLVMVIIAGAYIGNTYEEISTDSDFITTTPNFPMANYVMTHLLIFILAMGTTIGLSLYAKSQL